MPKVLNPLFALANSLIKATSLQNIEIVMTTDSATTQIGICEPMFSILLTILHTPEKFLILISRLREWEWWFHVRHFNLWW